MGWKDEIQSSLSDKLKTPVEIDNYSYVGGGSINETFKISTSAGNFFVKKNSSSRYPQMFQKEAKGLKLLHDASEIDIPEIVCVGEGSNDAFLILNYIDSAPMSSDFWTRFGEQLANLHKHTDGDFGLDHDNYIGSLYQRNNKHSQWSDFFREERLEFQVRMARNTGKIGHDITNAFARFYKELESIFPQESPALLHGDLWSGNFMVNEKGMPVIIDPAVYFGHREMDLGMSQLFGGFDSQFYASYNDNYPLEKGWERRLNYCNLYPLLVHVNLFGGGYVQSVKSIVNRF